MESEKYFRHELLPAEVASTIWAEQARLDTPAVNEWLSWHDYTPEQLRAVGSPAEMTGRFRRVGDHGFSYQHTFVPGKGKTRAMVVPVTERGVMVDVLAISLDNPYDKDDRATWTPTWGAVTRRGRLLGHDLIDEPRSEPLRVHPCERYWAWFDYAGQGVLPLRYDGWHLLPRAGDLLADDYSHALQILYTCWVFPARGINSAAARVEGESRIFINEDEDERLARLARIAKGSLQ